MAAAAAAAASLPLCKTNIPNIIVVVRLFGRWTSSSSSMYSGVGSSGFKGTR